MECFHIVNSRINPVIEIIHKRRSIRSYEPTSVPEAVIKTIIEAGNQAPSTGRMVKGNVLQFQPWRFVVVQDLVFKQQLLGTVIPIWKKFMENMKGNGSYTLRERNDAL